MLGCIEEWDAFVSRLSIGCTDVPLPTDIPPPFPIPALQSPLPSSPATSVSIPEQPQDEYSKEVPDIPKYWHDQDDYHKELGPSFSIPAQPHDNEVLDIPKDDCIPAWQPPDNEVLGTPKETWQSPDNEAPDIPKDWPDRHYHEELGAILKAQVVDGIEPYDVLRKLHSITADREAYGSCRGSIIECARDTIPFVKSRLPKYFLTISSIQDLLR